MQNHDYFMQTSQMLLEDKRYKEALELCEYATQNAVWSKPMERQCKALCMWTLAEAYFYQVGDAKSARDKYMLFLEYVDNDISMITAVRSLQEVMEDMYVQTCVNLGQLAVSYDEYFAFISKSESVRPLTQMREEQMHAVEYNRSHGMSWCDNIIQLAEVEARSVESGAIDRLPCAIAMYSLLLHYPETDPPIEVLRIALNNYSSFICRHVGESILHCAAKEHPANPDNYRFIFEQGIALVGEFLDDMETMDAAKEAQAKLVDAKSDTVDKSNFFNNGYASAAPPNVSDFIPPLILKEQIEKKLGSAGGSGAAKSGCLPVLMLSLGCIIAAIAILLSF